MATSYRSKPPSAVRGSAAGGCRHLVLVLGDQLWLDNPALQGFDPARDRVLMIEAASEATQVWSHKARIAIFLAAMRHFRGELEARGWPCLYIALADLETLSFSERLTQALHGLQPEMLIACEPGEWRMLALVQDAAASCGVPLAIKADTHFLCSREDFAAWAGASRQLRMENFYRHMRRRHGILMEGDAPAGARWNFDADNRRGYPAQGPGLIPEPLRFEPDAVTRGVLAEVEQRFGGHPGSLASFAWPVTRAQALQALHDFVAARLPAFGPFQDAMWTGTPWGWHALLSSSLNLRLLDPREVLAAAEQAWREGGLPLASVEGFVRQVLGWREFIRGVYWLDMPQLGQANHFGHHRPLPSWYWTGKTRMNCLHHAIGQTLEHGFAHHIQRLMVTGLFGLLAGVEPQAVCDWYLAVYVDAVEWVELPNTAGMALYADGGRFTSKPYLASGQYIHRMSNYCDGCAYRPAERTGPAACPFTTLYWHFLARHERELSANIRTAPMVRNLARLSPAERAAIAAQAAALLDGVEAL
jgi:deoxyribodipyrimidine photolyase-related protein